MELILKNGLENIYFGQSIDDAIEVFGKPDREYHNTDDENEFILEWNAFKLRLTFYENENRKLEKFAMCTLPSLSSFSVSSVLSVVNPFLFYRQFLH